MAETIDNVSERLTRLELTVAQGFHDLEQRVMAMGVKVDVQTEAIREDLQATAGALNAFAEESRRNAASIRKEHAADRAVLTATLRQHAKRIYDVESK